MRAAPDASPPRTHSLCNRVAVPVKEEIFHLSSTNWTHKSALQDKLSWVIRAGLEDLDDPDYMVGGERCVRVPPLLCRAPCGSESCRHRPFASRWWSLLAAILPHSDPVDPNDPLGLAGIDLEAMTAAGREGAGDGSGGFGSNIDVDFSNIDPEAMASANQIMEQLREQGWKPPEVRISRRVFQRLRK
jgi:hypothetical protein